MSVKVSIKKACTACFLALFLLCSFVTPALAENNPPDFHIFYGTLTCGGSPAPVGTVVRAKIDGTTYGIIVTTVVGRYGGAAEGTERLIVQGTNLDTKTIKFYISNQTGEVQADQTAIPRTDF